MPNSFKLNIHACIMLIYANLPNIFIHRVYPVHISLHNFFGLFITCQKISFPEDMVQLPDFALIIRSPRINMCVPAVGK